MQYRMEIDSMEEMQVALIKKHAAKANHRLKAIPADIAEVIIKGN